MDYFIIITTSILVLEAIVALYKNRQYLWQLLDLLYKFLDTKPVKTAVKISVVTGTLAAAMLGAIECHMVLNKGANPYLACLIPLLRVGCFLSFYPATFNNKTKAPIHKLTAC